MTKKATSPLNNDFQYCGIDYDYTSYDCRDSDCGCQTGNDYCRGSTYNGLRVTSVDLNSIREKFKTHIHGNDDIFIDYCIDRLLRVYSLYSPDVWEVNTHEGYYGEEIGPISMDLSIFKSICSDVESLYSMNPDDRIRFVLKKEYQMVLPDLLTASFSEEMVAVSSLSVGNEIYRRKIKDSPYHKNNYRLPIGIYLRENDKFRLIDGYHRFYLTDGKSEVNIIAAHNE